MHHGVVLVIHAWWLVWMLLGVFVAGTLLDGVALLLLNHHDIASHVALLALCLICACSWLALVRGRLVQAGPCSKRRLLAFLTIGSFRLINIKSWRAMHQCLRS